MSETQTPAEAYVGPDHVGAEIICVDRLSYAYPDGTEALRDVSLHVTAGSTLAVVGPNGAGKTTLLKILLGLLDGYTGGVRVAGMAPADARRRGDVVSWVPQRAKMHWDFPVTVEQVVRMGLARKTRGLLRRYARADLDYVAQVMSLLEIDALAPRPVGRVSGGQQQRAIIARALAARPAVLMLDEPTVSVDAAGVEAFAALMRRIREAFGVTLVLVSHDLRTIVPECQRIACLNRTLHFHDSPSRLTPELLGEVFRCDLTGLYPARRVGPDGPGPTDRRPGHERREGPA